MKILIVRMWAEELDIHNYNCQEIGLAKALVRKGNICDIVLYTSKVTREENYYFDDNKKIHIYYLKAKRILKNCFYEKKLYSIISNYDVVQSAEYDQIANIKLYNLLKSKFVVYHGPYKSEYTKRYPIKCFVSDFLILLHPFYKKVKIITKSKLAESFLHDKGYTNTFNIGVGLDVDRFKHIKENQKINELIKNKNNNKYILYVGKIENRRNVLFLLQVFNRVLHDNNRVKMIIVGRGEEEYVNKCKEYIKNNNLEKDVLIYDSFSQNELPLLYKNSDIFVFPTQYDIFRNGTIRSRIF